MAAALAGAEADITHVDMEDERAQDATDLRFLIAVRDKIHLESVLRNVKRTPSVMRAHRVRLPTICKHPLGRGASMFFRIEAQQGRPIAQHCQQRNLVR